TLHRIVQIVAKLQRELVLAWGELHVNLRVAFAEMNPRRRALDDRLAWLETSGIDPDVIVTDAGACGFHVTFGNCGDLVVLDTELQVHRALHRRAVFRLDEKDARLSCSPYRRRCYRGNSAKCERSQGQVAD